MPQCLVKISKNIVKYSIFSKNRSEASVQTSTTIANDKCLKALGIYSINSMKMIDSSRWFSAGVNVYYLHGEAAFAPAYGLLVCLPLVRPAGLWHINVFLSPEALP